MFLHNTHIHKPLRVPTFGKGLSARALYLVHSLTLTGLLVQLSFGLTMIS